MAKMSRSQLKSLIKECLVEVLVEGLNPETATMLSENVNKKPISKKRQSSKRRPALDNIRFDKNVAQSVSMATEDPILGEMLADINDPRYSTDSAFRQDVEQKVKLSNAI